MNLPSQENNGTGIRETPVYSGRGLDVGEYRQSEPCVRPVFTCFLVLFAVMFAVLVVLDDVWAHKVKVFAYVEGDTVVVQGYFGGGAKALNCSIVLYDARARKIIDGKTDTKGIYSVKVADLPRFEGNLKVVLNTGDGHKAEYTLNAEEFPGRAVPKPSTEVGTRNGVSAQQHSSQGPGIVREDTDAQAKLLEETLDRKLEPILRILGSQQKLLLRQQDTQPSFRDIIGGIGWIVGIVGVLAYFMSRRRSS